MNQFEFLDSEEIEFKMEMTQRQAKFLRDSANEIRAKGELHLFSEDSKAISGGLDMIAADCEKDVLAYKTALEADYWDYFPPK